MPGGKKVPGNQVPRFPHIMQACDIVPNIVTRWHHFIGSKFGHQMAPLALIPNLIARWCHFNWFQIWSPDGTTCISYKFGHQMARPNYGNLSVMDEHRLGDRV